MPLSSIWADLFSKKSKKGVKVDHNVTSLPHCCLNWNGKVISEVIIWHFYLVTTWIEMVQRRCKIGNGNMAPLTFYSFWCLFFFFFLLQPSVIVWIKVNFIKKYFFPLNLVHFYFIHYLTPNFLYSSSQVNEQASGLRFLSHAKTS